MAEQKEYIITPEFRVNFPSVFEPKTPKNKNGQVTGEPKYMVTMMFPKADAAQLGAIRQLCFNAAIQKYGMRADGQGPNVPPAFQWPWKDGDTDKMRDGTLRKDSYPEVAGTYMMEAKSKFQPGIVDFQLQDIIDKGQFYSGCYARAQVHAYVYDNNGNVGCGLGLDNLQKTRDGERLAGGGMAASDAFGAFAGGSNNVSASEDAGSYGGGDPFAGQQQAAPQQQYAQQQPTQQQAAPQQQPMMQPGDLGPAFPSEASGMDDVPF